MIQNSNGRKSPEGSGGKNNDRVIKSEEDSSPKGRRATQADGESYCTQTHTFTDVTQEHWRAASTHDFHYQLICSTLSVQSDSPKPTDIQIIIIHDKEKLQILRTRDKLSN